jgi:hypothetical protein
VSLGEVRLGEVRLGLQVKLFDLKEVKIVLILLLTNVRLGQVRFD